MILNIAEPLGLWLLPLCVVPLVTQSQQRIAYSSFSMLPVDKLSTSVDLLLRTLGCLTVVALSLGISGLFRAEQPVERIGRGAQTVILIDSSGSMDTIFANGNEHVSRAPVWGTYVSKGQAARKLLAEYAAQRPQDMFALFLFSARPISVLPLTEKQSVIQAAIKAGALERGLSSTDLGTGLIRSLNFFEGKPFTGSRIILMVSDGAAQLTIPVQDEIKYLLDKYRVTLYWLYLRARDTPGLDSTLRGDVARQAVPEQAVHKFFSKMGLPYRAFSAEDPKTLQHAIQEVSRLQNLPIRYVDIIPKQDLSGLCYGTALSLMLLLLIAKCVEISAWH
jgi:mxaC protein